VIDAGAGALALLLEGDVAPPAVLLSAAALLSLLDPPDAALPPPPPPPHAVINRVRQASAIQLRNGRRSIESSLGKRADFGKVLCKQNRHYAKSLEAAEGSEQEKVPANAFDCEPVLPVAITC
jgi:hypothetical protein